jgi:tetratricopeptide (TPR) repeat protein
VSTYAERPQLSQELEEKLNKTHGGELAHAVAVVGLGGTGKTQLVLRYLQKHQEEYDTVLWLDVRSVETARSSFERCCRALSLNVEASLGDGPLQDVPPVQAVLSLLRARSEDERWLMVLDNADDPSWVSSIVPQGEAGTVIVTSQDAGAARLLGGHVTKVDVDAMEPEEAVCVMSEHFEDLVYQDEDDECRELIEEITKLLDRLALALDLAGARIKAHVQPGTNLRAALQQYVSDYRHNQNDLLRDGEYARAAPYKKTMWTAWETSLASLRKLEQSQPNIYPIHLLRFMTLLDRSNVQDELFRLARLGVEEACSRLGVELPAWMQGLLANRADGEWNDYPYLTAVNLLIRYGLVRPIAKPWKGTTMHGLVRWRASAEMDREQYWHLHLAFVTAVCMTMGRDLGDTSFRRHVSVHLPLIDAILDVPDYKDPRGICWMWNAIALLLWYEGRAKEAEELMLKVLESTTRVLGYEHPETLSAMANLAASYGAQGRSKDAEQILVQVVKVMSRVLGEEHFDTLSATAKLAATYGPQRRWKEAEMLSLEVVEVSSRVLGEEHPATLTATANLAVAYTSQGLLEKGEELLVRMVKAMARVSGEEHPETLSAMYILATTYMDQGKLEDAGELFIQVKEARSRVLGEEHPDTLYATSCLAETYWRQGRTEEAEVLFSKTVEPMSRALGEEHPETLWAMAGLAKVRNARST